MIRGMTAPARIGRYRVDRRIGSGGFATVWLAYDEMLESAGRGQGAGRQLGRPARRAGPVPGGGADPAPGRLRPRRPRARHRRAPRRPALLRHDVRRRAAPSATGWRPARCRSARPCTTPRGRARAGRAARSARRAPRRQAVERAVRPPPRRGRRAGADRRPRAGPGDRARVGVHPRRRYAGLHGAGAGGGRRVGGRAGRRLRPRRVARPHAHRQADRTGVGSARRHPRRARGGDPERPGREPGRSLPDRRGDGRGPGPAGWRRPGPPTGRAAARDVRSGGHDDAVQPVHRRTRRRRPSGAGAGAADRARLAGPATDRPNNSHISTGSHNRPNEPSRPNPPSPQGPQGAQQQRPRPAPDPPRISSPGPSAPSHNTASTTRPKHNTARHSATSRSGPVRRPAAVTPPRTTRRR